MHTQAQSWKLDQRNTSCDVSSYNLDLALTQPAMQPIPRLTQTYDRLYASKPSYQHTHTISHLLVRLSSTITQYPDPSWYGHIFQQLVPGYKLLGTRWSELHAQPGIEEEERENTKEGMLAPDIIWHRLKISFKHALIRLEDIIEGYVRTLL